MRNACFKVAPGVVGSRHWLIVHDATGKDGRTPEALLGVICGERPAFVDELVIEEVAGQNCLALSALSCTDRDRRWYIVGAVSNRDAPEESLRIASRRVSGLPILHYLNSFNSTMYEMAENGKMR